MHPSEWDQLDCHIPIYIFLTKSLTFHRACECFPPFVHKFKASQIKWYSSSAHYFVFVTLCCIISFARVTLSANYVSLYNYTESIKNNQFYTIVPFPELVLVSAVHRWQLRRWQSSEIGSDSLKQFVHTHTHARAFPLLDERSFTWICKGKARI